MSFIKTLTRSDSSSVNYEKQPARKPAAARTMEQLSYTPLSLLLLFFVISAGAINSQQPELRSCEDLTQVPLCKPLYNKTYYPNLRGHQSQQEANSELMEFAPLIESNCSQYLTHFLCSYYAPLCEVFLEPDVTVPPCRELCVHVYLRCGPLMEENGVSWPPHLSCDLFPGKSEVPWCFGPDDPKILLEQTTETATNTWTTSSTMDAASTSSTPFTTSQSGPAVSATPQASSLQVQSSQSSPESQTRIPFSHTTDARNSNPQTTQQTINPTSSSRPQEPSLVPPTPTCQPLPSNSLCRDLGYSKTSLPNIKGQGNLDEATYELSHFSFLSYVQCSPNITRLLCYYYMPECRDRPPYIVQPCRELCESVKKDCSHTLTHYSIDWPGHIDCEGLPSSTASNDCSNGEEKEDGKSNPTGDGWPGNIGGVGGASTNKKLNPILIIVLGFLCMITVLYY